MWLQRKLTLPPKPRGFHLITREVTAALPEMQEVHCGLLHVFICHTSASLSVNENADPSVRRDFERFFNRAVPEDPNLYEHRDEGPDDMPAHLKGSLLGCSLILPVGAGTLQLGVWQGIYLGEHRDHGGARKLVLTLQGETH